MILLEDTRNQVGKHKNITKYCQENNIEIVRTKLVVGDYALPLTNEIAIDTKYGLQEIMKNITEARFKNELKLAKKLGIHLVVLIEEDGIHCIDDVANWKNQRLEMWKFQMKRKLKLFGDYNEWYLYRQAKEKGIEVRKPPQSPEQLRKSLHTIEENKEEYDVKFMFCGKNETGAKIIEILVQ